MKPGMPDATAQLSPSSVTGLLNSAAAVMGRGRDQRFLDIAGPAASPGPLLAFGGGRSAKAAGPPQMARQRPFFYFCFERKQ